MLTARARLKLKPSTDTRGRAYIVADAAALRTLAQACELAARGAVGIEICTLSNLTNVPHVQDHYFRPTRCLTGQVTHQGPCQ